MNGPKLGQNGTDDASIGATQLGLILAYIQHLRKKTLNFGDVHEKNLSAIIAYGKECTPISTSFSSPTE